MENTLRESLAEVQHEIWSHWMNYLLSVSETNEDGSITIPANHVDRWRRQIRTSYVDLPNDEKMSDRDQADKVIEVFNKQ